VESYDLEVDNILGVIVDKLDLPDMVFRPSKYRKLTVEIPSQQEAFVSEFDGDMAKKVYPNMPRESRFDRLVYLQQVDESAYCDELLVNNNWFACVPSPPMTH
jgi:hypothetical protein